MKKINAIIVLSARPLTIALLLLVFLWMGAVGYSMINMLEDHYFPYEGKVVKIGTQWIDHIAYEQTPWEHLMIETPEGHVIDKVVSFENRIAARIEEGDYVIKNRGFGNRVRPLDKKTVAEILESIKK